MTNILHKTLSTATEEVKAATVAAHSVAQVARGECMGKVIKDTGSLPTTSTRLRQPIPELLGLSSHLQVVKAQRPVDSAPTDVLVRLNLRMDHILHQIQLIMVMHLIHSAGAYNPATRATLKGLDQAWVREATMNLFADMVASQRRLVGQALRLGSRVDVQARLKARAAPALGIIADIQATSIRGCMGNKALNTALDPVINLEAKPIKVVDTALTVAVTEVTTMEAAIVEDGVVAQATVIDHYSSYAIVFVLRSQ